MPKTGLAIAAIMYTELETALKQHQLPEALQLAYLSAIAAFMQFRYKDQQMLIKSDALMELK